MFCDNPRCKLHQYENTSRNTLVVREGDISNDFKPSERPKAIEIKEYGNAIYVEPMSGEQYNLCEVCAGVLVISRNIKWKHDNLHPLARAITRAVNNENDPH
ncbi:hypothetical protein KAR91_61095 [Candidatus Pacearchaeota archaeon]|nr:hypothetical protein [Candidatus Pacearchaeota archaeon]